MGIYVRICYYDDIRFMFIKLLKKQKLIKINIKLYKIMYFLIKIKNICKFNNININF